MNWLKKNICLVIIFVYNKLNDNYNTIKSTDDILSGVETRFKYQ